MQTPAWRLAPLAFVAGVVPLVTVHLALWVSIAHGTVEPCNPYLDGCTSISRAGRHGLANHLFKAFMLPYAVVLAGYWWACGAWLRGLGSPAGTTARWLPVLGIVAALFLILYASFLGSDGEFYRLMRRYGVTVYFAANYLAQLLLARALWRQQALPFARTLVLVKVVLCALVLSLGLANVAGSVVLTDNAAFENIIEWNAALLMTAYFFLTWRAWRQDGFALRFAQ